MIDNFKLRHLDMLLEGNIDYATMMVELNGYTNTWWNKRYLFMKSYKQTYQLIEYIKSLDPKLIELNRDCKIAIPDSIDDISFSAMMELHALKNSQSEMTVSELIAHSIAITCFTANATEDFDIDSIAFKQFKTRVEQASAIDMLGISNWIDVEVTKSAQYWQQLFLDVNVEDKDYQQAGGQQMDKFNIINTIKAICVDFNVEYKQAWQMSYSITQINSLSKATSGYIQNQMSIIKEARMKANRRKS
jgi:hypothetical protein